MFFYSGREEEERKRNIDVRDLNWLPPARARTKAGDKLATFGIETEALQSGLLL